MVLGRKYLKQDIFYHIRPQGTGQGARFALAKHLLKSPPSRRQSRRIARPAASRQIRFTHTGVRGMPIDAQTPAINPALDSALRISAQVSLKSSQRIKQPRWKAAYTGSKAHPVPGTRAPLGTRVPGTVGWRSFMQSASSRADRAHPRLSIRRAMAMARPCFLVGVDGKARITLVKMIPIKQHGAQTREQTMGNGDSVALGSFRLERCQRRAAGTQPWSAGVLPACCS